MSRSRLPLGSALRTLLVLLPVFGGGVRNVASTPSRPKALRIQVPGRAGMAVCRALLSAKRRLAAEPCRIVLSDFNSTSQGRPLRAVLDSRGRTPEEHLDTLVFKDGSGKPRCFSPAILAFTRLESDTIYICTSQFMRATEADPAFAEMVLIHEVLHTLGLGENPPSSRQITAQVTERCGDWPARQGTPLPSP